jgi:peptidoglycan/LPS O-acetylase OafA/YrhL
MIQNTAPRTYGIDLLRGVACMSVLLFHYLSHGPRIGAMPGARFADVSSVAQYGYLGVHLFFMVSGYVIFMSAVGRTPRQFLSSRVARLYPAFWAAVTLTMLLIVWADDPRYAISLRDFAWNLTLIPQYVRAKFVDGAYWSLAVELQFYIMVWVVLRARLLARVELLLWGWLLLALIDVIRPMDPVQRWLIAQWAPLFTIGATAFLISSRRPTTQRIALLLTAFLLAIWHAVAESHRLAVEWQGPGPRTSIVVAVLVASVIAFLVFALGLASLRNSLWVTMSGVLTYPVYLVHQVAGYLVYTRIAAATGQPVVAIALCIVLALATGAAIHYWVERPSAPRLRRLVAGEVRRVDGAIMA